MQILKASKKVVGGKLVRVEVEFSSQPGESDCKITRVKITGDFFLHPEERLGQLEESLVGMLTRVNQAEFEQQLVACVQKNGDTTLYGASLADLAEVLFQALNPAT